MTLRVFISYASEDRDFRQSLETHLAVLQQQQVITVWHKDQILPGSVWNAEIQQKLDEADIILFLVSADLLASKYVKDTELPRAMERRKIGVIVIPIILRHCDWKKMLFGQLQALPDRGSAVTSWGNQDEAFTNVAKGIRRVCEEINRTNPGREPTEPTLNTRKENGNEYNYDFFSMEMELRNDLFRNTRKLNLIMYFGEEYRCIPNDASNTDKIHQKIRILLRGGILKLRINNGELTSPSHHNEQHQSTIGRRHNTIDQQNPTFTYSDCDSPDQLPNTLLRQGVCLQIGQYEERLGDLNVQQPEGDCSIDARFEIRICDILVYDTEVYPQDLGTLLLRSIALIRELSLLGDANSQIPSCLSQERLVITCN